MATLSLQEFKKRQLRRIASLKKMKRVNPTRAAMFMAAKARSRVPLKTGEMRQGIRRTGTQVTSTVRSQFPYHLWVNQSRGYRTLRVPANRQGRNLIRLKNGNVRAVPSGTMVYGSSPVGWSWTGVARYWDLSLFDTRQFFRKDVADAVGKVLAARAI